LAICPEGTPSEQLAVGNKQKEIGKEMKRLPTEKRNMQSSIRKYNLLFDFLFSLPTANCKLQIVFSLPTANCQLQTV